MRTITDAIAEYEDYQMTEHLLCLQMAAAFLGAAFLLVQQAQEEAQTEG